MARWLGEGRTSEDRAGWINKLMSDPVPCLALLRAPYGRYLTFQVGTLDGFW